MTTPWALACITGGNGDQQGPDRQRPTQPESVDERPAGGAVTMYISAHAPSANPSMPAADAEIGADVRHHRGDRQQDHPNAK